MSCYRLWSSSSLENMCCNVLTTLQDYDFEVILQPCLVSISCVFGAKMPGCFCNVLNCSGDGKNYFRFPVDPERRKKWIESTGVADHAVKNGRVCNKHFSESDFVNPNAVPPKLKRNVIPSIQVPHPNAR